MFIFQIIMMALRGLWANLLRSLLATLGVIAGVAAVIAAMSILEGSQRNIRERFESMGGEAIMVYPTTARAGGRVLGFVQTLSLDDVDYLGDPRNCPSIAQVAPEVMGSGVTIKYFGRNEEISVLGTSERYAEMFSYKVVRGRMITRDDVGTDQKVVVLGHKVAKDVFGGAPAVNRPVNINRVPFRVIGVMEKKGNIGFRNVDSQVIVPVTTAMNRLFGLRSLQSISIQAVSAEKVTDAIRETKRALRKRHDIRFSQGQKDDFQVVSQEEMRKQISEITTIFQLVLYLIAGISLVVGGIGIMNIMLVSVTERTREIGVRMAVGAQRWNILQQFLIEASVISLLGGAFGVGLGYFLSWFIRNVQDLLEVYTPPAAVYIALAMATLTGILSGFYPAYKAAKLDPVEALRYE